MPVRLEVGPRDLADGVATLVRRRHGTAREDARRSVALDGVADAVAAELDAEQAALLAEATDARESRTADVTTLDDAREAAATGLAAHPVGHRRRRGRGRARAGERVTVRCLRRADGSLPESDDEPGLVAVVGTFLLMPFPIAPPVSPMLAKLTRELPASGGKLGDLLYEPKWDGFRAIVFRDGDDVEIGSRNEKPLTRYFPDLVEPLRANLPERCVVDGEIVIATERGLDFDRLSLRIHPAESRVGDARGGDAGGVRRVRPARRGRRRPARAAVPRAPGAPREGAAAGQGRPCCLTPATTDRDTAGQWFDRFEGAGLDGVVAKPLDGRRTSEGKRTMLKVKHLRTADCVVAGFRFTRTARASARCCSGSTTTTACCTTSAWRAASRRRPRTELARRARAVPRRRARRPPVARVGRGRRRGGGIGAAPTRRAEPVERGQGPQLGAAAPRARRRGRVRAPAGRPLPPHRAVPALAPRPRAVVVHLRAARRRRCRWSSRRSSGSEGIFGV